MSHQVPSPEDIIPRQYHGYDKRLKLIILKIVLNFIEENTNFHH